VSRRIVLFPVLVVLLAASAYAQKADLFLVVVSGTPQEVQAAIDSGASVKARRGGMTPLLEAAGNNRNPEVITILLKAGADVNDQDASYPLASALLWAAYSNPNPEVINILLKAGADLNGRDQTLGRTALMWAAGHNPNPEVITFLLKCGSDPKAKADQGETAFQLAGYRSDLKDTDAFKLLEEASQ
jgi:uncharacterized protein